MDEIAIGGGLVLLAGAGLLFWYRSRLAARSTSVPPSKTASGQTSEKQPARTEPLDLTELCRRLDKPLAELTAHQPSYTVRLIPKNHGGKRRLEIPDDSTKELQRCILKRLLQACECHPMACAFEEAASIVDAAVPHQGKRVIVKIDIRRFFESTTAERIHRWWTSIGWSKEAADLLTRLTTCEGHLPQGAPTSPRLSNLVNSPLDRGLLLIARGLNGDYSRYADDITMSFEVRRGRPIRGLLQKVGRVLKSYGYQMHGGRKLRILRQHQQQRVLGLVVNEKVALPRKTRRWLRAVRHRMETGGRASLTKEQLEGWESLNRMVEEQRRR